MKIVLDTNVLISGIFWSGPPYKILKAWQNKKIKLVLSEEILKEYDFVANELAKKYPAIDLAPFMELLTIHAELHTPVKLKEQISRDPADDMFIACALAAKVKIIVSGDKDLLTVTGLREIEVLKPSTFVQRFLASD
ncbi:MAG TPA: putative toxin-antitoxin system toxin component, PIN family [Gammaproteobacteria bacterium]|nr:putative toxin-antitoxin system toxin component, PIN family [Gammaproteobacteria bacterium]